ncbi:ogr/Delta-like zinc finger family protein [Salmonella enterica subsp. enterica]|nr:ogr/Delta-like zinc finger family protein [Salmonella enterica subsp. enterica serovar Gbadago]
MQKRLKSLPFKNKLRGIKLRSPKIICPECNSNSTIKKTVRKHPHLSDVYCACNNVECGHTFVVNMTFSHTLSPSAITSDRAIKTLIDMMSPGQRQIALNLLQPQM